ncbi:MAG TPA: sigma-70 family RNA polymerase sigma factor [Ktedonobacterales bacterium]
MGEARELSAPDSALGARFTRLLDLHQAALHSFAFSMVSDRELAHDIVQEAFVAAWRIASHHEAPFSDPCDDEGVRRWLFAVTYRQAALVLRKRRHVVWQSLDVVKPDNIAPASPDIAIGVVEADALRSALSTLTPVDAACFLLQAVHGFSTREIADVVQLRPDVVRKRLSRSRQRLRDAYIAQSSHVPNA